MKRTRALLGGIALLLTGSLVPTTAAFAAPTVPAIPYGSHSTPLPSGWATPPESQTAADAATLAAYRDWKTRYLVQGCGVDRFYVDSSSSTPYTVVSEGQGYGMVMSVYFAGADPDARAIFDGLFRYVKDHPSENNPALMAWQQTACRSEPNNSGSATDGDLDIAYALLLAHKQWGSTDAIDYLSEAKKTIAAIKASEFNPSTRLPLLGDWVSRTDPRWTTVRSSDLMIDRFTAFARATGDSFWTGAAAAANTLIHRATSSLAPATGLLPDFLIKTNIASPQQAPANHQEGPHDGDAYWNASRVPWRLAANALHGGSSASLAAIRKQTEWIRTVTRNKPAAVRVGYSLAGNPIEDWNSVTFTAPYAAGALTRTSDQSWLNAVWKRVAPVSESYFADSVKVLTMLVVSGNTWQP